MAGRQLAGRHRALATLIAILALLAAAAPAGAAYDPLASGVTKLSLDNSFLTLMKRSGVKLSAVAPAKLQGGVVSFPVTGGKFDPTNARGVVEHEGALVFRAGNRSIPLKALQLKTTQKRSPFSAKVGGNQLKLATAKSLSSTRSGFGEKVAVTKLALSGKLATRLGKKLRLRDVFEEGVPLGSSQTKAQPETVDVVAKNKASLALAPGFAAKLDSLFVAVNPIFPAEHPGAEFTLPIFGGKLAPTATLGTLETSGSLELLQLGGGQVFWAETLLDLAAHTAAPEVNVQPSPPYAGKLGRTTIAALTLPSPAVTNARARTIAVSGATLALDAATAATFNEVFAKPQGKDNVFVAGEALGSVSFTAQGQ